MPRPKRTKAAPEIDPQLESFLRPLSDDEYRRLREDIRANGIRDHICYFERTNGDGTVRRIVLDGHNRLKIAREVRLNIANRIMKVDGIKTITDAKLWMLKNQASRRNLSGAEYTQLIGRQYNELKADSKSEAAKKGHSDQKSAAEQVAEEHGVSESTVRRAGKREEIYDSLDEDLQVQVANLPRKPTDSQMTDLASLSDNSQEKVAEQLADGMPLADAIASVEPKKKPTVIREEGPTVETQFKRAHEGMKQIIAYAHAIEVAKHPEVRPMLNFLAVFCGDNEPEEAKRKWGPLKA